MSSKINSTVEVNGTRYDALTGQMLTPKNLINKGYGSGKKMVDGFVIASHNQVKKVKAAPARAIPKAEILHKRPQRSTTLMRRAVKKPPSAEAEPKDHGHHHGPSPQRVSRAKTVSKHAQVSRFGFMPTRNHDSAVKTAEVRINARASYRDSSSVTQPRMPSMVSSVSHKKLEQMLDEALTKADAHKTMMGGRSARTPRALKRLPKWLSLSVAAVLIIVVAFWLIWQNLPSVAVHVAAARAHVNAVMPAYTPEGFGFAGRINYNPGTVTMEFKDKTNKSFSLTQKASNLNSSVLPDTYLKGSPTVQTSMIGGTTVYIYGEHNDAAWVNHGVLYDLKNSADLPADQVLKIVQGM